MEEPYFYMDHLKEEPDYIYMDGGAEVISRFSYKGRGTDFGRA